MDFSRSECPRDIRFLRTSYYKKLQQSSGYRLFINLHIHKHLCQPFLLNINQLPTFLRIQENAFGYKWTMVDSVSEKLKYFKGTVQRKLAWVQSGINRQLIICQSVAWYFYFILKDLGPLNLMKRFSAA
jgi:hypothetical protein